MKRFIFIAITAIAGWLCTQAQSMPAPEKYNEYIEQVAALDPVSAEFLMEATMESLSTNPKGYRQMLDLAEKRFSDAADPIHNESLYMVVLKHATEKFVLSASEKERQRLLLEGAKKNMIGTAAADFDYVTQDDKATHRLNELKADYILVYFNNPDCESCEAVKERLNTNELINQLVKDKKLIVLAIYPYDDQKLWKKAKYPKMMINGWNKSHTIEYGELYDLPTLPCFYLLDRNHIVLVKNEGSLNKVEAKLKELIAAQETGPSPDGALQSSKSDLEKMQALAQAQAQAQKNQSASQQLKPKKQENTAPAAIPAPADDPNTARSEQIIKFILDNQGEEIYNRFSDKVKGQLNAAAFENILTQVEGQAGKYQSHEAWQIQQTRGVKAYTSVMNFEKAKLALILVYDEQGNIFGMNFAPAEALKQ